MLMFTVEKLPKGCEIKEMFSMIEYTSSVQISKKGIVGKFFDKEKDTYQSAMDNFAACAPERANAIIGVRVSTATQEFSNGIFLYITYIGTPVFFEKKEKKKKNVSSEK